MDLCNRSEVKRLLEKYSLAPKKAFGQNFLVNPAIPQMIAESSYRLSGAEILPDKPSAVLEIGPGIGALTCRLAEYYDRVVAVEIDRGLLPLLDETMADFDNVEVVSGDVMELDIKAFISEKFGDILSDGGTLSVCANLPYYITTPIIMKLLEAFPVTGRLPYAGITVMIQLEVADRLASHAGASEYGAVTASVAMRANVQKLFNVSAGNFHPAPKVASAVIGIVPHGGLSTVYPELRQCKISPELLGEQALELITLGFSQRRKTLVNAASSVWGKDKMTWALEKAELRSDIRAEKLSPYDFCHLADILLSESL